jgi:hypothetical protein
LEKRAGPSSGSHHPIIRRNRSIADDVDGIFICWRVQNGLFEGNEFRSIGGIARPAFLCLPAR